MCRFESCINDEKFLTWRFVTDVGPGKAIFDAYVSGGYSLKEIGDQIALLPDELHWTRNKDLTPYCSPVRVYAVKAANIAFT